MMQHSFEFVWFDVLTMKNGVEKHERGGSKQLAVERIFDLKHEHSFNGENLVHQSYFRSTWCHTLIQHMFCMRFVLMFFLDGGACSFSIKINTSTKYKMNYE